MNFQWIFNEFSVNFNFPVFFIVSLTVILFSSYKVRLTANHEGRMFNGKLSINF